MKVLVACEESQVVCKAFRRFGADAYSCDLQKCSGGRPGWHIQGNVLDVLYDNWDLVIAFPPCTYLSNVNSPIMDDTRAANMREGANFFKKFVDLACPHCIENPIPMSRAGLPKYSQIIQPWQFGHPYTKSTCLWLYGLPKLISTKVVYPYLGQYVQSGARTGLYRSKTFPGVAFAMAAQWSCIGGI